MDLSSLDDRGLASILGRPLAPASMEMTRRHFVGRRVMVTGAAGSIGGALCQALVGFGCASLTLLDHADHALLELMERIGATGPRVREILCDVRDIQRLDHVFTAVRPDIVIHAAALKHVHMGERHPGECVLTNLQGAANVQRALANAGGGQFVLVSTDKAANPVSVMGATKRLAELWVRQSQTRLGPGNQAVAVRFGNVFGTQGSVGPVFAARIAAGLPLKITHPDMTRYFMTPGEAVSLILTAAAAGGNGATGTAYLLEMGEPVRIVTLAERMIAHAGLRPHVDIPIEFSQLREGERLYEDLFDSRERLRPTRLRGVLELTPRPGEATLTDQMLADLSVAARTHSDQVVRQRVFATLDAVLGADDAAEVG